MKKFIVGPPSSGKHFFYQLVQNTPDSNIKDAEIATIDQINAYANDETNDRIICLIELEPDKEKQFQAFCNKYNISGDIAKRLFDQRNDEYEYKKEQLSKIDKEVSIFSLSISNPYNKEIKNDWVNAEAYIRSIKRLKNILSTLISNKCIPTTKDNKIIRVFEDGTEMTTSLEDTAIDAMTDNEKLAMLMKISLVDKNTTFFD